MRILDTATLGALDGVLPEDLLLGHLLYLIAFAIEHGENPEGLEISFNDILLGLLEAVDYPWEELPFDQLPVSRFAPNEDQDPLTYRVSFELDAQGATPVETTVQVTLPEGFAAAPSGVMGGTGNAVPLDQDGQIVTAQVLATAAPGVADFFTFEARPGIVLGTFEASVVAAAGGVPNDPAEGAPVTVVEHWEDPASAAIATAPTIRGDIIYLSHIATPGDVDYFRVPVTAAGKRISVRLTNLDHDADLVMYQPAPSAAPLHRVGLDTLPLDDDGYANDARHRELAPETLQDVPVQVSPLHRVSANRGTEDEAVELTTGTADVGDDFVIQVSSYNGATSDKPYVLRVRITDAPPPPSCDTGVPPSSYANQASPIPQNATPDTLFVVNESRLRAVHGSAVDDVQRELATLLGDRPDLGIHGAVLNVDASSKVLAAYAAWDAPGQGCKPELANAVAAEIAGEIARVRDAHPTIEHVVLVGGDDILPFTRVPDTTRLNQSTYADSLGAANPIAAAFATEHALSDDPYGDASPARWLNRQLYVSEVGVGRLVEDPSDIAGQLALFRDARGHLDPSTALVTGYDFLTDGAAAVKDNLSARQPGRTSIAVNPGQPGAQDHFLSEDWSKEDVTTALFGTAGSPAVAPDIASINAHYDHHRSLPAAAHAAGSEDDLFSIEDVEPQQLAGRILFTMGCHAGLAVPDAYVGTGNEALAGDWAQTLGRERAVYLTNTGYGYGDDTAVALSSPSGSWPSMPNGSTAP
jgi:hypothetical protein